MKSHRSVGFQTNRLHITVYFFSECGISIKGEHGDFGDFTDLKLVIFNSHIGKIKVNFLRAPKICFDKLRSRNSTFAENPKSAILSPNSV